MCHHLPGKRAKDAKLVEQPETILQINQLDKQPPAK
jgi:hypothetical protein